MKNLILSLSLILAFATSGIAQKVAYVDTRSILENMAEYKQAQEDIDALAENWRNEITQQYDQIEKMYQKYQAEEVLLSETMKKQRQDEIIEKEKQARELQKKRFGPEGDLFQKRQALVKPIQDKLYNTIQSYATSRGYDIILDKSDSVNIIFANPDYDITKDIISRLGK